MNLTSSKFQQNGEIPKKYTCDGDSISPPLAWSDVPAEAKSLVLIVEDADAVEEVDQGGVISFRPHPDRPWVHWVLYNIPLTASGLREGGAGFQLPPGTLEGVNGRGETGYFPPCPPPLTVPHNYFHRLWAVNFVLADLGGLNNNKGPSKADLLAAIQRRMRPEGTVSNIVAKAELVGTYQG
jgi:Raf kinase inhibitor-like YbhB/YbcL family protein